VSDAARIARRIAEDNRSAPRVWSAWFETLSAEHATMLIASLKATRINAVLDGSSNIVCATFDPGDELRVATHAESVRAKYLEPRKARRLPQ